jgi:hypothetical protein
MLWQNKLACLHRLLLYIFIITDLANKMLELSLNKFSKMFTADVFADSVYLNVYFLIPQEDFDYTKKQYLGSYSLIQLYNTIQDLTFLL